jgi:hypothetical protein
VPDVGIPDHLPRPTSEHQEDTQGEDPSNHWLGRPKVTTVPWAADDEERTTSLDQVRSRRGPDLCHYSRRTTALGKGGDRLHLS